MIVHTNDYTCAGCDKGIRVADIGQINNSLTRYKQRFWALALHVEKLPQELFNMQRYRDFNSSTLDDCGTVGCIMGGPS
jgi:hypothetical protein